jgi:hypothetical protein
MHYMPLSAQKRPLPISRELRFHSARGYAQVGSLHEIKELRRGSILRKCAGWVIEAEVNERLTARRAALDRQL